MKPSEALYEAQEEFYMARRTHDDFHSAHEAYAVMLEEVDELWDEVKSNAADRKDRMRAEAKQVAAMAIRLMVDCT